MNKMIVAMPNQQEVKVAFQMKNIRRFTRWLRDRRRTNTAPQLILKRN
jgi:hypothetical protein